MLKITLDDVINTAGPMDMFGFSSASFLGFGINIMTCGWPFIGLSHVAVKVMPRLERVPPEELAWLEGHFLFESTVTCDSPCACCQKVIHGVQLQPLERRLREYNGRVYYYQCPAAQKILSENAESAQAFLQTIEKLVTTYLHIPYDVLGALRARDLTIIERIFYRKKDLSRLYCSESAATMYGTLFPGVLNSNYVYSPNKLAKALVTAGILSPAKLVQF